MSARKLSDHPDRVAAQAEHDRRERRLRTVTAYNAMPLQERLDFLSDAFACDCSGPPLVIFDPLEVEAKSWATFASLPELVAYGAAIACQLSKELPSEFARQMLIWGWKMASPELRKAFAEGVTRKRRAA